MYVALIAAGSNGDTKTWTINSLPNGCNIEFGKTGSTLQKRLIPVDKCVGRSPFKEAHKRVKQKLRSKGYEIVSDSDMNLNTDAPHHLLGIEAKPIKKAKRITAMESVRAFLLENCDVLLNDFQFFIDTYVLQGKTKRQGLIPSSQEDHLLILFTFMCIAPDVLGVAPYGVNEIDAEVLYDKFELLNVPIGQRIAMASGLLPAPEIYQDSQQTAQEWFF